LRQTPTGVNSRLLPKLLLIFSGYKGKTYFQIIGICVKKKTGWEGTRISQIEPHEFTNGVHEFHELTDTN
jgi:hypothetical protein